MKWINRLIGVPLLIALYSYAGLMVVFTFGKYEPSRKTLSLYKIIVEGCDFEE